MIQIVYETLKDQQEGKKGRASVKTGGASETTFISVIYLDAAYVFDMLAIVQTSGPYQISVTIEDPS